MEVPQKSPKWMVCNGKSCRKMDDLGVPLFQETSICVHAPASQSPNPSTPTPTQPATAAPEGVAKQRLL